MIAAQTSSRFLMCLFVGKSALDTAEIRLSLACVSFGNVNASSCLEILEYRRRKDHIRSYLMMESEIFIDICRCRLSCRDSSDDRCRSRYAVTSGKYALQLRQLSI